MIGPEIPHMPPCTCEECEAAALEAERMRFHRIMGEQYKKAYGPSIRATFMKIDRRAAGNGEARRQAALWRGKR